ncbi:DUF6374 family protein [Nocardia sp. CY41]|uniref:DUF6374 family protein n=1 Tax=Nocardia sp. CY41 TaxID=2608686 RepID=UPI0013574122|nr:DUF6374 family protein [Nocardia sp. CY41]
MPETTPSGFAERQIAAVRRQLLDAAAFGKVISPDQLEHMAANLSAALEDPRFAAPRGDSGKRQE